MSMSDPIADFLTRIRNANGSTRISRSTCIKDEEGHRRNLKE